jgi:hypothetical protein
MENDSYIGGLEYFALLALGRILCVHLGTLAQVDNLLVSAANWE